jgi:hypothetical protein
MGQGIRHPKHDDRTASIARQWFRRVADDEDDEPAKAVPNGPWTSKQIQDIFRNRWDYGFYYYGKGGPHSTRKEEAAIANHLDKSGGDGKDLVQRILRSVNRIKDPMVALRMASACGWLMRMPSTLRDIYDRHGYCDYGRCVNYMPHVKEAMLAAQQVYWWKALQLSGARDLKMPTLSVTPPPKPEKPKFNPPAVPSNLIPTTVDGWQLYDKPGAGRAARALAKSMAVVLRMAGKHITPLNADGKNAKAVSKLLNRMDKVRDTYSDFGASDSDPRGVVKDVLEGYLKLYLDEWEYRKTFNAFW